MTSVVVAGALANKPASGGEAWVRLSYLVGLQRLGCGVRFVEQIGRQACTARALAYFDAVTEAFGVAGTLIRDDGRLLRGAEPGDADLLLNLSGNLTLEPYFGCFRRRAYLDLDPGYTQLWFADGHDVGRLAEHHVHFTVGTSVGTSSCDLPTTGIEWRPTQRPIVLQEWPAAAAPVAETFTTVASWRGGYGRMRRNGVVYGQKAHEFRKVAELPRQTRASFEVALSIEPADEADRALLERNGWRLVDPRTVACDPAAYRRYVQASSAEFSPAQGIYVETCSGWVGDRTAAYLASGRPAVVQETGLGLTLPLGEGLLTFRTLDEAARAVDRVRADWATHSTAARAIAEEHFDSDIVLASLLEDAL